jgi:hypothetical protein
MMLAQRLKPHWHVLIGGLRCCEAPSLFSREARDLRPVAQGWTKRRESTAVDRHRDKSGQASPQVTDNV